MVNEHFKSAETFYAALQPTGPLWRDSASKWIFRGQANADWNLKPLALRAPDTLAERGFPELSGLARPDGYTRDYTYRVLLERFQELLDRSGITMPNALPLKPGGGTLDPLSHPQFLLMALAQHHGMPTLLLDWTRSMRIAAYFAAGSALDPETKGCGSDLAVWGLMVDPEPDVSSRLRLYKPPAATNPNLRAQQGLFVVAEAPYVSVNEYVDDPALDATKKPELVRLTMPVSDAPRLLRWLSHDGIDGASMFPGVGGVVRALQERHRWDRR